MFPNRPLTWKEKNRLHPNERQVINHYEKQTRLIFMRHDVIVLKEMIRVATPAQINKSINVLYVKYPERFQSFDYVQPYVENLFKNRRRGASSNEKKE
jgi:hypothetical protein